MLLLLNDALIKEHPQLQRHLFNSFLDLNRSGHHHHPSWCSMLLCFSAPCLISPFCFRATQIYVVALALPSLDHSVSTFWSRVIASSHPFILFFFCIFQLKMCIERKSNPTAYLKTSAVRLTCGSSTDAPVPWRSPRPPL